MSRKNKKKISPPLVQLPSFVADRIPAPVKQPKAAAASSPLRALRKDQERALSAYAWANKAKQLGALDDYEIAVQSFAATLLRSGFAAAVSVIERNAKLEPEGKPNGFTLLLDSLAAHPLPGIPNTLGVHWPDKVRALADLGDYMHATREMIALLAWVRRACRAIGAENGP